MAGKFDNIAHTVGIQGSIVHESNVYVVHPDATPEQKYAVGVRYLHDGVPAEARRLIGDAIAHGYETGEVRFHWMLAMLSKRSLRDLSAQEQDQLELASRNLESYLENAWKRALTTVFSLLTQLNAGDCSVALKELRKLPPEQRDKILRHLDLVLTGGAKESLWAETKDMAERLRMSNDRSNRVWAYFEPDPIGARARQPVDDQTVPGDRTRAVAWSVATAAVFGFLGWTAVRQLPVVLIACLALAGAVYVGGRNWSEWRYRSRRLAAKERDHVGRSGGEQSAEPGFVSRVSRDFEYYFSKYLPDGVERQHWRSITSGIRRTLRDEVVEIYRESRTEAERVKWLVRHLASDVRTRWSQGTLHEHRVIYRVSSATKAWCIASFVTGGAALLWLAFVALQADLWWSMPALFALVAGGREAALGWYWIVSESRRAAEDREEYEQRLRARSSAYEQWKQKLDATRPSESEMENWLTCDRTVLLDKALRHYGLVWRDIITHAFLSSPAKAYKRARVRRGPWRYSKYDARLFLITQDGVREVSTELDFEHAALGGQERTNFRFDAVSSVHVVQSGTADCKLELTLFNGPSRNIRVVDAELGGAANSESTDKPSEASLDSAGFAHTLHILEGIAAEGKNWIKAVGGPAR
ncbi:hypothetical protein UK23_35525 [Lentzea aerocolonigenes]|uniref:Uncharacterized protein n=2 Tax=Lentzea aerocolonigenes TaxID=68170 RepID=A0A0F0GH40_LENAE|nr:hypothetical protein UK23_35525 [Lentzea aerocolonigenes]